MSPRTPPKSFQEAPRDMGEVSGGYEEEAAAEVGGGRGSAHRIRLARVGPPNCCPASLQPRNMCPVLVSSGHFVSCRGRAFATGAQATPCTG